MRRYSFPLALFVLSLSCLASIEAGTLIVNTTDDHADGTCDGSDCTLRDAIIAAQPNDTIQFEVDMTGTITLTGGQLVVDKSLTISGPGARVLSISGNGANRIFAINSGVTAGISGLTLTNGLVDANIANGGGILNQGNLTVTACSLLTNTAMGEDQDNGGIITVGEARGGAIYNQDGAILTARDSTFASNNVQARSKIFGGAVWNGSGTAVLINSTFSANTLKPGSGIAAAAGGAVFNNSGTVVAVNCTIVGNTYSASGFDSIRGGGIYNQASCKLQNTIISDNAAASSGPDVQGAFSSNGFNLIGNTSDSTGWVASDLTDANATPRNLTALTNNGGPTDTHAPQPGSVAINAGSNALAKDPGPNLNPGDGDDVPLTNDQRTYMPRIIGSIVDIGAVEFDPPAGSGNLVVSTTDEHDDGTCGVGDCSLREAISAANADPDPSTIGFKPGLSGTILNSLPIGITISQSVTIKGPGARTLAISGNGSNRVFSITGGTVAFSGLTIKLGKSDGNNAYNGDVARGKGGAIVNTANLTLTDCTVTNNFAIGEPGFDPGGASMGGSIGAGGAIYSSGNLTLTGCTFYRNTATGGRGSDSSGFFGGGPGGDGLGGAVSCSAGLTITNCTFNDNTAVGGDGGSGGASSGAGGAGRGGGINSEASLSVTNCTISGNFGGGGGGGGGFGDSSGGGISLAGGGLINSIIAGNATNAHQTDDVAGSPDSVDHTLIGVDPMLAALTDNGGPTDTMRLLTGSPAIDAGKDAAAPKRDQRHYARKGLSDIGAFESNGIPLHITSITRNGLQAAVTFDAIAGETYRFEVRSDMASGDWVRLQAIPDKMASTTGPMQFSLVTGATKEFYHVLLVP